MSIDRLIALWHSDIIPTVLFVGAYLIFICSMAGII